jgi:hypothetical protein
MSDPDRNPHFRRRWGKESDSATASQPSPPTAIGTFGLVLREAMERRRRGAQDEAGIGAREDPPR